MSTQDFPRDPSRTTPTPSGKGPLKSAAIVPEDPFTEPSAGPPATPTARHVPGTAPVAGTTGQHAPGTVPLSGGTGTSGTGGQDTKTAAKDEAREVGHEGVEAAKHVGQTAKEEAGKVAHEAKDQVSNLVAELGSDLKSQAGAQQQKVAEGLRAMSDELRKMADGSDGGTATSLVDQAAGKTGDIADWLDGRDPGSLLEEVRGFARRRPGVFLAVAAGAGLLAGRLARGATAKDTSTGGAGTAATGGAPSTYATPAAGVRTPAEPAYQPAETHPPTATYPAAAADGPEGFPGTTDRGYPRP
ncbi:hypothetical protein ACX8Z9_03405 [Arthrobacter halodurans]|uniref:Uncharacterized protein n=1 Tax=Arthrobacter halodurans TaxID=516699 RepID=A0ABV4UIT7_9MICC